MMMKSGWDQVVNCSKKKGFMNIIYLTAEMINYPSFQLL